MDRFSDSLLNLTVVDAQGVLNGYIRELDDWSNRDINSFSVNIPPLQIHDQKNSTTLKENEIHILNFLTRIKPYPSNSVQVNIDLKLSLLSEFT